MITISSLAPVLYSSRIHTGKFIKFWEFSNTPEEKKKWIGGILIFSLLWLSDSANNENYYQN